MVQGKLSVLGPAPAAIEFPLSEIRNGDLLLLCLDSLGVSVA